MNIPQLPSFQLNGKRALVAGASSGIGLGCAAGLAQMGAHVTLAARSEDKLNALAVALRAQGHDVDVMVLDVANVEDINAKVGALDPFDVMVNSAGLARHGDTLDTKLEDFDAVSDINLRGAYFLSVAVAKKLIAAGKPGSIINITSQMAHVGGIERAVYCGTKHGVEGFTKSMAIDWGPHGIRINTVCPTFVRTALTAPTFEQPDKVEWITRMIKLGRVAEVEDIMGAVVFLASDASAMITGTSILVDGGWTAE